MSAVAKRRFLVAHALIGEKPVIILAFDFEVDGHGVYFTTEADSDGYGAVSFFSHPVAVQILEDGA